MKQIEAKAGKKFKPGDFVYVKRLFQSNAIGMIIRYLDNINAYQTNEEQEIYEVLVSNKISSFNEILLFELNEETSKKLSNSSKN